MIRRFQITPRDRRAATLGAVTIVCVALTGYGWPLWRAWRDARLVQAEVQLATARRVRGALARARATRDSTRQLDATLAAAEARLLPAGTPVAVAAGLALYLADAAATGGARLGPVDLRPDTIGRGPYLRVAARTEITGDVSAVMSTLAELEAGPMRIGVDMIEFTQPDPTASADRPEQLRATLVVAALALRPGLGRSRHAATEIATDVRQGVDR